MFRKLYYARIDAVPCLIKETLHEYPSQFYLCDVSNEHYDMKSLLQEVKDKNWAVGNKWYFEYEDTVFIGKDKIEYKKRRKKLAIKEIKYYCKSEKIFSDVEELLPENDFKEKSPSNNVLCCNVQFLKNGIEVKSYSVLSNGKDYMEKLYTYLKEHNLEMPESEQIMVSFEPFYKNLII